MTTSMPPPRFAQAEDVIDQVRRQVLSLAEVDDPALRQRAAAEIVDQLCEIEHLLEIHRSHG